MAALAALLLIAAWRGPPPRPAQPTKCDHLPLEMGRSYVRLAGAPVFLGYSAVLMFTTGTFYAFLAGAPTVLASYGVGPAGVGWYILCVPLAYVTGNFLTSHLLGRVSERRLMILGQGSALTRIGLVLLLGISGLHTPFAFACRCCYSASATAC